MNAFFDLAEYYDAIYYDADTYEAESRLVSSLIEKHIRTPTRRLLDIACGTGTHIKYFRGRYNVSGLDLSPQMLQIAKEQHPDVHFYNLNLVDFEIDQSFDVLLCLYGSIGFVGSKQNLTLALRTFAKHVAPGGVLVLTPWSNTSDFKERIVSETRRYQGFQVSRMEKISRGANGTVDIEYHYLIGKDLSIEYYTGHHPTIGLFSLEEYQAAIIATGLEILELHRSKEIQMEMAYICRKPPR